MGLQDAAGDSLGQIEVVGVDDEPTRHRLFLLPAVDQAVLGVEIIRGLMDNSIQEAARLRGQYIAGNPEDAVLILVAVDYAVVRHARLLNRLGTGRSSETYQRNNAASIAPRGR
jgi:hypothetical protein